MKMQLTDSTMISKTIVLIRIEEIATRATTVPICSGAAYFALISK